MPRYTMQVPEGTQAGAQIQFQLPSGMLYIVVVPEGKNPGDQIEVDVGEPGVVDMSRTDVTPKFENFRVGADGLPCSPLCGGAMMKLDSADGATPTLKLFLTRGGIMNVVSATGETLLLARRPNVMSSTCTVQTPDGVEVGTIALYFARNSIR
jgi:hypothetical protein